MRKRSNARKRIELSKFLKAKLGSVTTDRGTLEYDGPELEEGTEVYITDEDGTVTVPADGDYVAGERIITVENGVVTAIEEPQGAAQTQLKQRRKQKHEGAPAPAAESGTTVSVSRFNELVEAFAELQNRLTEQETALAQMDEQMNALQESVDGVSAGLNTAMRSSRQKFFRNDPEVGKRDYRHNEDLRRFGLK